MCPLQTFFLSASENYLLRGDHSSNFPVIIVLKAMHKKQAQLQWAEKKNFWDAKRREIPLSDRPVEPRTFVLLALQDVRVAMGAIGAQTRERLGQWAAESM